VLFYGVAAIVLREAVRRTEITDGGRHGALP